MQQIFNPITLLWLIFLFLKLALSAWLPLSNDESYYWVWAHRPQLSYYDHPPFVAWIFQLGIPFESWANAVRWPGVLVSHLTSLIWILILKPHFDEKKLLLFAWLLMSAPLIGIGSIIITPDTPMLFFWALSVWCFQKLMTESKWHWAFLLGLFLGAGFTSKYLIVLLGPLLLFLGFRNKNLSLSKKLQLVLVALPGFFIASSPVWIWNAMNSWISFGFQLDHGLGAKVWKPMWTLSYVLGQILILFPVILFFAFNNRSSSKLWLHVLSWPILIFFFVTSFRGHVEVNWPIMATAPLLALAVGHTGSATGLWLIWTARFWLFLFVILIFHLASPWLPLDNNRLKTRELDRYSHLTIVAKSYQPLFARSYQMAAKLSYESKLPVHKLKGLNRRDFYDFIPESTPKSGIYFLILEQDDLLPPWTEAAGHKIIQRFKIDGQHDLLEVSVP